MSKVKQLTLYIIVVFLIVGIIWLFLKIFAFNKDNNTINYQEVTSEQVEELYSYLPTLSVSSMSSMYNNIYTAGNNLNYAIINLMAYNYIKEYDSFKLESVTSVDKSNVNQSVIYKISKENMDSVIKKIFGQDIKYDYKNFNIDESTSGLYKDNYLYIYNKENVANYVIYKNKVSYTVTDNGNTIKIYDYFLKCDKVTKMCYNDDAMTMVNGYITYQENMVVNESSNVQMYEHTYKLENDHYYWLKTELG